MCVSCVRARAYGMCVRMYEKDGKYEGGEKIVPFTNTVKLCCEQWYSCHKRDVKY